METDFLLNASFQRVETDFMSSVLLLRADFLAVETIIHIKVMPFFYRITSLLLLETIFYVFFSFLISCHRKQFFCVVETYLFKEDFIQSFTQLNSVSTKQKIRFQQRNKEFADKLRFHIRKSCFHFKKSLTILKKIGVF